MIQELQSVLLVRPAAYDASQVQLQSTLGSGIPRTGRSAVYNTQSLQAVNQVLPAESQSVHILDACFV